MESVYLLIPVSLGLVFVIAAIFWWSVRSGQFDDMEGPAFRILVDDDQPLAKINEQAPVSASGPVLDAPSSAANAADTPRV